MRACLQKINLPVGLSDDVPVTSAVLISSMDGFYRESMSGGQECYLTEVFPLSSRPKGTDDKGRRAGRHGFCGRKAGNSRELSKSQKLILPSKTLINQVGITRLLRDRADEFLILTWLQKSALDHRELGPSPKC